MKMVAIPRAMALSPSIFLLDEAFEGLASPDRDPGHPFRS
jgi:ABC-type sulfate/molybdate transport systems ATPase subunit